MDQYTLMCVRYRNNLICCSQVSSEGKRCSRLLVPKIGPQKLPSTRDRPSLKVLYFKPGFRLCSAPLEAVFHLVN